MAAAHEDIVRQQIVDHGLNLVSPHLTANYLCIPGGSLCREGVMARGIGANHAAEGGHRQTAHPQLIRLNTRGCVGVHLSKGLPKLFWSIAWDLQAGNSPGQRWQQRDAGGLQTLEHILHIIPSQQGTGERRGPQKLRLAVNSLTWAWCDPVPMNRKLPGMSGWRLTASRGALRARRM